MFGCSGKNIRTFLFYILEALIMVHTEMETIHFKADSVVLII